MVWDNAINFSCAIGSITSVINSEIYKNSLSSDLVRSCIGNNKLAIHKSSRILLNPFISGQLNFVVGSLLTAYNSFLINLMNTTVYTDNNVPQTVGMILGINPNNGINGYLSWKLYSYFAATVGIAHSVIDSGSCIRNSKIASLLSIAINGFSQSGLSYYLTGYVNDENDLFKEVTSHYNINESLLNKFAYLYDRFADNDYIVSNRFCDFLYDVAVINVKDIVSAIASASTDYDRDNDLTFPQCYTLQDLATNMLFGDESMSLSRGLFTDKRIDGKVTNVENSSAFNAVNSHTQHRYRRIDRFNMKLNVFMLPLNYFMMKCGWDYYMTRMYSMYDVKFEAIITKIQDIEAMFLDDLKSIHDSFIWNRSSVAVPTYTNNIDSFFGGNTYEYDPSTKNMINSPNSQLIQAQSRNYKTYDGKFGNYGNMNDIYKLSMVVSHLLANSICYFNNIVPIFSNNYRNIISSVVAFNMMPEVCRKNEFNIVKSVNEINNLIDYNVSFDANNWFYQNIMRQVNIDNNVFMLCELLGAAQFAMSRDFKCRIYSISDLYRFINLSFPSNNFIKNNFIFAFLRHINSLSHDDLYCVTDDDSIFNNSFDLDIDSDLAKQCAFLSQDYEFRYGHAIYGAKKEIINKLRNSLNNSIKKIVGCSFNMRNNHYGTILPDVISSAIDRVDVEQLGNIIVRSHYGMDQSESCFVSRHIRNDGYYNDIVTMRLNIGGIFKQESDYNHYVDMVDDLDDDSFIKMLGVPLKSISIKSLSMGFYPWLAIVVDNSERKRYDDFDDSFVASRLSPIFLDKYDTESELFKKSASDASLASTFSSCINILDDIMSGMISMMPKLGILIPTATYSSSMPIDAYVGYSSLRSRMFHRYRGGHGIYSHAGETHTNSRSGFVTINHLDDVFMTDSSILKDAAYMYKMSFDSMGIFDFVPSFFMRCLSDYRNRTLNSCYPYVHEINMDYKIGVMASMYNSSGVILHNSVDTNVVTKMILAITQGVKSIDGELFRESVAPSHYYRSIIASMPEILLDISIAYKDNVLFYWHMKPGCLVYGDRDYFNYEKSISQSYTVVPIDSESAFNSYAKSTYYGISADFETPLSRIASAFNSIFMFFDDGYLVRKSALPRLLQDKYLYDPFLFISFLGTFANSGFISIDQTKGRYFSPMYLSDFTTNIKSGFLIHSIFLSIRNSKNSLFNLIFNSDIYIPLPSYLYSGQYIVNPLDILEDLVMIISDASLTNSHKYGFGCGKGYSNTTTRSYDHYQRDHLYNKLYDFNILDAVSSAFGMPYNSIHSFVTKNIDANLESYIRPLLNTMSISRITADYYIGKIEKFNFWYKLKHAAYDICSWDEKYTISDLDYSDDMPSCCGVIQVYRIKNIFGKRLYNSYNSLYFYIAKKYKNKRYIVYFFPNIFSVAKLNIGLSIYDYEREELRDYGGYATYAFDVLKSTLIDCIGNDAFNYPMQFVNLSFVACGTFLSMLSGTSRVFSPHNTSEDEQLDLLSSNVSSLYFYTPKKYIRAKVSKVWNKVKSTFSFIFKI